MKVVYETSSAERGAWFRIRHFLAGLTPGASEWHPSGGRMRRRTKDGFEYRPMTDKEAADDYAGEAW